MKTKSNKFHFLNILIFILILSSVFSSISLSNAEESDGLIESVSISGDIKDNFADITYEFVIDNTNSDIEKFLYLDFGLQNGLRLHNISVQMGETIYYGVVKIEEEAIQDYNNAIKEEKSAVLIRSFDFGYALEMYVEPSVKATVKIYFEGILKRNLGIYNLNFPFGFQDSLTSILNIDLNIISHYSNIIGYSIQGLGQIQSTPINNGLNIQYSSTYPEIISKDLKLIYRLSVQSGGSQLLTYNNGQINYFSYLLAPEIQEIQETSTIIAREFVFVIDNSGSMSGQPIDQAKIAFNSMIQELNEEDSFNIITFASNTNKLWDTTQSATLSNIQVAKSFINNIVASGSTNFHSGCLDGMDSFIESNKNQIMLVLSDGMPTAGITDSASILQDVSEKQTGSISISSIGFGTGIDEGLLVSLASNNHGYYIYIEPNTEASTKLLDFYKSFSVCSASDYSITISGGTEIANIVPLSNTPFLNGSEIIISGKYSSNIQISTSITYENGPETYLNNAQNGTGEMAHLERLWAQQRINCLLKNNINNENKVEIINLAIEYGIVVQGYTAIILVVDGEGDSLTDIEKNDDNVDYWAGGEEPWESPRGIPGFNFYLGIFSILTILILFRNKKRME